MTGPTTAFTLVNETPTSGDINLDQIYKYNISESLQRQNTVVNRSMIQSRFQRAYKEVSIGFNQSRKNLKKASEQAENKNNHEAYRILIQIYQELKGKIN